MHKTGLKSVSNKLFTDIKNIFASKICLLIEIIRGDDSLVAKVFESQLKGV